MKAAIILFGLSAVAFALPTPDGGILRLENVLTPEGTFRYGFKTSEGFREDVVGEQKDGTVVRGSYEYTHDGIHYKVTYSADENGFQAYGDHLPKSMEPLTVPDDAEVPELAVPIPGVRALPLLTLSTLESFGRLVNHAEGAVGVEASHHGSSASVLRSENVLTPEGSFRYGYETSDGLREDVVGEQKEVEEGRGTAVQGSYEYTHDGIHYTITYTADENGFQAHGDHLPKPVEPLSLPDVPVVPSLPIPPLPTLPALPAIGHSVNHEESELEVEASHHGSTVHHAENTWTSEGAIGAEASHTGSSVVRSENAWNSEGELGVEASHHGSSILRSENAWNSEGELGVETSHHGSSILRSENVLTPEGSFRYGYETSGGLREDVVGEQKEVEGGRGTAVQGSYEYTNDGVHYTITYTADENGFQAHGDHLPKSVEPLPVPDVQSMPELPTLPVLPSVTRLINHEEGESGVEASHHGASILRLENVLTPEGSFRYGYETSDGMREDVVGEQKDIQGERGTAVQGSYEYTNDGVHYTITYTADENGFQAHGDHLPKSVEPLPVPDVQSVPELPTLPILPPVTRLINHEEGELEVDASHHASSVLRSENVLSSEGELGVEASHHASSVLRSENAWNSEDEVGAAASHHASSVLRSENVLSSEGSFRYGFETSDGLREDVVGEQKEVEGGRGTAVQGSYEYTHNGVHYTVTYTADENGFQAHGDHFPKPVESLPVADVPASTLPVLPILPSTVRLVNHEEGELGVETSHHGSSILRLENVLTPEGSFRYGFETSDGHHESVVGEQKETEGGRGTVIHGSYEYTHNGVHYTITYTADEHGFLPIGDHLPRPVEPLPMPDVPIPVVAELEVPQVRLGPVEIPLVHEE